MVRFTKEDTDYGVRITKIEDDGKEWGVPTDPANSDYQAYLASLEAAPQA